MEASTLWTATETNQYLYKQMKALLEPHGFVVSTMRAKHLIRIREHHIQMVCPVVIYSNTVFEMHVLPGLSYTNFTYCSKRVHLKRFDDSVEISNATKLRRNYYSTMAVIDQHTGKHWYPPEELQRAWTEVMVPQLKEEILHYFDTFGFTEFTQLSQNQKNGTLSYCGCPRNDDALRLLTMACNAIWMGDYESSLPLLKKAVAGYEKAKKLDIEFDRSIDLNEQLHQTAASELIEIMEKKRDGWKDCALEKLCLLEKDSAEKAWGIALDEHGNTVRVKKKKT